MSTKAKFLTVVIVLVVVGGGALYYAWKKGVDKTASSVTTTNTENNTDNTAPVAASISYDGNGFSPDSITVKSGDKVTIKNDSQNDLNFKSNPHPIHTDNTELNVGEVAPGESKTFTVTKVGTWGYHNHLSQTQQGTIIVQ